MIKVGFYNKMTIIIPPKNPRSIPDAPRTQIQKWSGPWWSGVCFCVTLLHRVVPWQRQQLPHWRAVGETSGKRSQVELYLPRQRQGRVQVWATWVPTSSDAITLRAFKGVLGKKFRNASPLRLQTSRRVMMKERRTRWEASGRRSISVQSVPAPVTEDSRCECLPLFIYDDDHVFFFSSP